MPDKIPTIATTVTAPVKVIAPTEISKVDDPHTAPNTTAEENLTTAGQRRVNLIWEYTQAIMTIIIVLANVLAAFFITSTVTNTTLTNAMFVVLGFYYGRTNHQRVGGVLQGR